MKISVRLDKFQARKLRLLRQVTGESYAQIVRRAIDLYFEQIVQTQAESAQRGMLGS